MAQRLALLLAPLLLLAAGCDVLTDVTLGAGTLPAFDVDRAWRLQPLEVETCPVGRHQVVDERSGAAHDLDVTASAAGCRLTFLEPDAPLLDAAAARRASDALDGRPIQAVERGAVEVSDFSLTDSDGFQVDVSAVGSLRMSLDEAVVLDHGMLDRLQAGEAVRSELPVALLDRILEGVNRGEAVHADMAVVLEVAEEELRGLPDVLHLRMRLQPEVTVDVLEFVGG